MSFGKKADVAEKAIFYLLFGVVLTGIFFVLVFLISSYINVSQEVPDGLREKIFLQRFVSSPYCFVYKDADTGRSYPGIIDFGKFEKQGLDFCFESFSDLSMKKSSLELVSGGYVFAENFAFRLTLSVLDPVVEKVVESNNWLGNPRESFVEDVLVLYDGKLRRGRLRVEVSG